MVRLNLVLSARTSRDVDNLLEAIRFVVSETRLQDGCTDCSAWADPNMTVHYGASWIDEPTLRRHVQSALFTSLLAVAESMGLPPHVQFDFVSHSRGLDYVAEVRGESLD
jgi:hypothetical protein